MNSASVSESKSETAVYFSPEASCVGRTAGGSSTKETLPLRIFMGKIIKSFRLRFGDKFLVQDVAFSDYVLPWGKEATISHFDSDSEFMGNYRNTYTTHTIENFLLHHTYKIVQLKTSLTVNKRVREILGEVLRNINSKVLCVIRQV